MKRKSLTMWTGKISAHSSARSSRQPRSHAVVQPVVTKVPSDDATQIQRAFFVHRKFGAIHYGRGHHESERSAEFHCLQRGQPSGGSRPPRGVTSTRVGSSIHCRIAQQKLG